MNEFDCIMKYGRVYKMFTDEEVNCPLSYIVIYNGIYYLLQYWNDSEKTLMRIGVETGYERLG